MAKMEKHENQSVNQKPVEEDEQGSTKDESSSSSSTITDIMDDASSLSFNGPLYELSELMAQLPIKRGLSKHYEGKSQSFRCLKSVKKLEDLAKKKKPSKLYNRSLTPKPTIAKKVSSRVSFL